MGRNNWGSVSFLCNIKHKYVHKDRHIYIQIDWLKVTKLIGQRRLLGGKGGTKQEQAKNMKLEGRSDSSQVVNGGEWLYIQFMLASGPFLYIYYTWKFRSIQRYTYKWKKCFLKFFCFIFLCGESCLEVNIILAWFLEIPLKWKFYTKPSFVWNPTFKFQ